MFKLLIPPFPLSPASCPSCHPLPFPFSLIWCFNRWINDCFYSELLVWEKRRERETEQNTEWNNRHSLSETMCRHLDWINLHPKQGKYSALHLSSSLHICHLPALHQSLFLSLFSLPSSLLDHGCFTCGPRAKSARQSFLYSALIHESALCAKLSCRQLADCGTYPHCV